MWKVLNGFILGNILPYIVLISGKFIEAKDAALAKQSIVVDV